MSVKVEWWLIAGAAMVGGAYAFLYDNGEAALRRMRAPAPLVLIWDVCFWLALSAGLFGVLYRVEGGKVRAALLPFVLLGAVVYFFVLAPPFRRLRRLFIRAVVRPLVLAFSAVWRVACGLFDALRRVLVGLLIALAAVAAAVAGVLRRWLGLATAFIVGTIKKAQNVLTCWLRR
ncbi:MAG: spore cortex biosynthesis protein YabQ [Hydrogenibacillus sp.]|nr:spore cortex biosynthesis protein YabQ [Hydrogenibacillus sp.]